MKNILISLALVCATSLAYANPGKELVMHPVYFDKATGGPLTRAEIKEMMIRDGIAGKVAEPKREVEGSCGEYMTNLDVLRSLPAVSAK